MIEEKKKEKNLLKGKSFLRSYAEFAEHYQFNSYKRSECLGVVLIKVLKNDDLVLTIVAVRMIDSIEYDLEEFDNYLAVLGFLEVLYTNLNLPLLID